MTPGSYSGLSTSIYQEGVRIPPVKLYERGKRNEGVMRLLLSNMRLPEERLDDLEASLGACRVAEERIERLVAKYGRDTVLGCIAMNLDRSERRLRVRVRGLSRILRHGEPRSGADAPVSLNHCQRAAGVHRRQGDAAHRAPERRDGREPGHLVHDTLVELLRTHPAPLRAWGRIDDEVAGGDCPMDAFGRRVLGVAPGDTVIVRTLRTPRVAAGLAE